MPGFMVVGDGGGERSPENTAEVRRKHRWSFITMGGIGNPSILLVLREAQRPNFKLEEPDMHHNQEQVYFAGKQSWDPIKLTWYDIEQEPNDVSKAMWDWLQKTVQFPKINVQIPSNYKQQATLQMENGAGTETETWKLFGAWPKEMNWQDLNYTSTDLATIECTLRYDRAERTT